MSCQVKTATTTQSWISSEYPSKILIQKCLLLTMLQPGGVVPQQCSLLTEPEIHLEKTFQIIASITRHYQVPFSPHCQVATWPQQWHPMAFSLWGSFPQFHSSVTFSWVLLHERSLMPKNINICIFKVEVQGHRRVYKYVSGWNSVIWLPKQVNSFIICSLFQIFEFHPRQINSMKRQRSSRFPFYSK